MLNLTQKTRSPSDVVGTPRRGVRRQGRPEGRQAWSAPARMNVVNGVLPQPDANMSLAATG
jgi:hypothetical protein